MQDKISIALAGAALLCGLILTGCNREGLPGLGRVTGTITMDGKPVSGALVAFDPVDGSAAPAMGRTDADGNYELYYSRGNKGAKVGESTVRINTYQETGEDDGRQIQKETIPSRYNVHTELKATVERGNNKFDFALKSGGEIIQPNEEDTGKTKRRSVTGCN
jgi:hypothetical protein